jgi:hypothetical protein
MQVSGWKVGFRKRSNTMDAYTIGLVILALALINKIITALSLTVISVAVVAGVVIAVIGRRKK